MEKKAAEFLRPAELFDSQLASHVGGANYLTANSQKKLSNHFRHENSESTQNPKFAARTASNKEPQKQRSTRNLRKGKRPMPRTVEELDIQQQMAKCEILGADCRP